MNKLKQYQVFIGVLTAAAMAVSAVAALRENAMIAMIAVLVLGLGAAVLNAKYKIEVYRIIGEEHPGSYERLVREGSEPAAGRPPYPPAVQKLLKGQRRFQLLATWLPILDIAFFCLVGILTRQG